MRSVALIAFGLLACSDPVLEQRVADLETKVVELEKKAAEAPKAATARPAAAKTTATPEQEEAANELLKVGSDAMEAYDFEKARDALQKLVDEYPGTKAAGSASRVVGELAVVGRSAGKLETEKWYSDQKTSFDDGKITLVVFWEAWCPHCRKEIVGDEKTKRPKLEDTWQQYKGKGLNLVALTRVTKSATDEKVEELLDQGSATYPAAKEGGTMADRFGVQGVPAAAVVKDGKIIWRGHPARITDDMFKHWLDLPA